MKSQKRPLIFHPAVLLLLVLLFSWLDVTTSDSSFQAVAILSATTTKIIAAGLSLAENTLPYFAGISFFYALISKGLNRKIFKWITVASLFCTFILIAFMFWLRWSTRSSLGSAGGLISGLGDAAAISVTTAQTAMSVLLGVEPLITSSVTFILQVLGSMLFTKQELHRTKAFWLVRIEELEKALQEIETEVTKVNEDCYDAEKRRISAIYASERAYFETELQKAFGSPESCSAYTASLIPLTLAQAERSETTDKDVDAPNERIG